MLNQPKVCIINETNIQGYFCPNGLYLHIPSPEPDADYDYSYDIP